MSANKKTPKGKPLKFKPLSKGERKIYEIGFQDGAELLAERLRRKVNRL